jgi:putative DNA primase/helicase
VEEWAQPGTTHYIDFDSDYATKPSCRAAIIKFAQLLIERGCTVHITCWDAQFKGLDDFIVGKGEDAFLQAAADAPAFAEWEKLSKKNKPKTNASNTNNSITPPVRTQENVVCLSSSSSND